MMRDATRGSSRCCGASTIASCHAPSLIGGPRIKLMSTLIYQQSMGLLNWPFGGAIAFVMPLAVTRMSGSMPQ